ncbi:MAG: tRNA preQ1(34) S-adenosylmethionine ribosyltransferase-isomerase QueA [Clostridiales bacterium]|nr:tRNA preQ1(34) S-adenosylmethionine ribosyltransferase-isomerase QueA [Clostridiales bacterium]
MDMKTSDFYYELPPELIAQRPLSDRSASRLLVLDKNSGKTEHRIFKDIKEYLNPGDCLVVNETRVIPARLIGERKNTGARVEILLLKRIDTRRWETLVYPGKKAKPGNVISFGGGLLEAEIEEVVNDGNRIVKFSYEGIFEELLDRLGQMPLPPYITEKLEDKNRYQTVYAKNDGSAAAPTAGLHFTEELLKEIEDIGVKIARLTLHVGLGTFRPVKVEDVSSHKMHSEFYSLSQSQADIINETREKGGRVVAVGTTTTRTLESIADERGRVTEKSGWTDIFIYPGYKFKLVDNLITNFHLPESTLVMLVSALAGKENIMRAYKEAIDRKYRFFSFGDAMFITTLDV